MYFCTVNTHPSGPNWPASCMAFFIPCVSSSRNDTTACACRRASVIDVLPTGYSVLTAATASRFCLPFNERWT